jgi:arsenite/tail-anchored protein-transporting ATPase
VVDAPRACVPLDSAARIAMWNGGQALLPVPQAATERGQARVPVLHGDGESARILVFAGKGGVGKTTCSASVALQLAAREPVTLLSVDPAHSVRDVFANRTPPPNLTVETIDTRAKWRRFRDTLGEQIDRAIGGVSIAYDSEAMRKLIEVAPPGADELFAITHLADLIAEGKRVVVDTAPTGHFLRLIDLPKTAGAWVHEFMRILLRYRELIPAGTLGEELLRASRALHSVEETLKSERCRIVVVTRPERIVVAETQRLLGELDARGMRAGNVIVNYVTPETDCPCDQSMRGYELEAIRPLGDVITIERRDEPPVTLDELATLVTLR